MLTSFCDPLPPSSFVLLHLSLSQWRALLPWLDISGLALYLYDRLSEQKLLGWIPEEIEARFQENLKDNTERMHNMLTEAVEIQERFQRQDLEYLLLKGFSLIPSSAPRPQLRSQLDLDFLVTADAVEPARKILEERGFVLQAVSGRSWEFKTPYTHSGSLRDLYRSNQARSVELHVEALVGAGGARVLDREWRDVCGFQMPVLPPVQLFLGQAAHLYKHISTGFFRSSHVLELYRHMIARRDDSDFWSGVQEEVSRNRRLALPLGVTTALLQQVMGLDAPGTLAECVDGLSGSIYIWTEKVGPRCVYASWPGTKLHLLLQREVAGDESTNRSRTWRALIPRALPPAIAPAPIEESIAVRMRRSVNQVSYVLFRLRYHVITGMQYVLELARWKRELKAAESHTNVSANRRKSPEGNEIPETNKGMTIL